MFASVTDLFIPWMVELRCVVLHEIVACRYLGSVNLQLLIITLMNREDIYTCLRAPKVPLFLFEECSLYSFALFKRKGISMPTLDYYYLLKKHFLEFVKVEQS
jgi:hypothetical protein